MWREGAVSERGRGGVIILTGIVGVSGVCDEKGGLIDSLPMIFRGGVPGGTRDSASPG